MSLERAGQGRGTSEVEAVPEYDEVGELLPGLGDPLVHLNMNRQNKNMNQYSYCTTTSLGLKSSSSSPSSPICSWKRFLLAYSSQINFSQSSSSSRGSPSSSPALETETGSSPSSLCWAYQAELQIWLCMSYFYSIQFMMISTFSFMLRVSIIFSCSVTFLSMKSRLLVTIYSWLTIFYSQKDITSAIFYDQSFIYAGFLTLNWDFLWFISFLLVVVASQIG